MDPWIAVLTTLCAIPVVATSRALGELLAAPLSGMRLVAMGLGRGKPLYRTHFGQGPEWFIGPWLIAGPFVAVRPSGVGRDPRHALHYVGRLLGPAILAIALATWRTPWWTEPIAAINLGLLLVDLAPWKIRGWASSGWRIMSLLRPNAWAPPFLECERRLLLRTLEEDRSRGQEDAVAIGLLRLDWLDVLVGRSPFQGGPTSGDPRDELLVALRCVVASGEHRLSGRPLAALRVVKEARQAVAYTAPQESSDLVTLEETKVWLDLDEIPKARASLGRLVGATGVVGREASVLALRIALRDGTPDEVEAASRRVRDRLPWGVLDTCAAIEALWLASRASSADGRTLLQGELAQAARDTALRLLESVEVADRAAIVDRLGEAAGLSAADGVGL